MDKPPSSHGLSIIHVHIHQLAKGLPQWGRSHAYSINSNIPLFFGDLISDDIIAVVIIIVIVIVIISAIIIFLLSLSYHYPII